ncbi:hypothetical protein BJ322DRAFT_1111007 [Thelephora terrestris]|uniref:Uncharacterized protein n=1 Tax=Thelephora terrestris TaxID=56493 RepID=A0A9P6L4A9_9AGAM|nr:hypothetical protein BJ322DRAFT_1111007 [Thelephora terrestris]
MSLNVNTTPFDATTPYNVNTSDVVNHLYDTPTAIACDNEVAQDFLRQHEAPFQVWDQAGHLIPLLDTMERDREERIIRLEKRMDLMGSSPSIPSLESCSSPSDGEEDFEEEPEESDYSFWTAVSPIEQGSPSSYAVEAGSRESSGQVWVQSSE